MRRRRWRHQRPHGQGREAPPKLERDNVVEGEPCGSNESCRGQPEELKLKRGSSQQIRLVNRMRWD
jgi:hypothetical protein